MSIPGNLGGPGEVVRKIRERMNLTQVELADLLGVHWVTVCRWENGRMEPKVSTLTQLLSLYRRRAVEHALELLEAPAEPLFTRVPHALAYDLPRLEGAIRDYILEGLAAGFYVFLVSPRGHDARQAIVRWRLPKKVLSSPRFLVVDMDEIFFLDKKFDINQLHVMGRKLAQSVDPDGRGHVRWVTEMEGLLSRGVGWKEILVLESSTDSTFHIRRRSAGLSIYPVGIDPVWNACLLCRHPWLLASGGFVRNPYYADPLLCLPVGEAP